MTKQKTKNQLILELEQAQKRITELEKFVNATRKDELDLKGFLDSTPDAMIISNSEGRIILANTQTEKLFGYTQTELTGMIVEQMLPERLRATHLADRTNSMKHPQNITRGINREIYALRKDGCEFPVEVSLSHHNTENGAVILSAIRDVTERKQTEEDLKETRERLLEAQAMAHIGHWEWDLKRKFLIWSDEVYRIFGVSSAEFTPTVDAFENAIHPDDKEDFLCKREKMLAEKHYASIDHRIILPDGQIRHVQENTQLILDSSGNVARVIGTVQDITERKEADEARRESDNLYRLLFETMVQGVVFQDHEGHIIHANPSARDILGLTLEQMLGRASIDPRWATIHENGSIYPGEDHPAMIALRSGEPVHNKIMGVYNPIRDSYCWLNVNAIPRFKNGNSKPYQVYTTFEDITERKQAENALAASEKKLQSLISSQTHFVIRIDMQGNYIYWNPQFEKEFGWLHYPDGLQNASALKTICEHHHQRVIDVVQRCISQPGQVFSVEIDKPAHNEGIRTTLWEFMCITDEHNQPSEIQCMGVEITDRKKAEEALRESEAKYRLLAENASDVIWILDLESSRFSYVSPSVMRLRGYSVDEVLAQDMAASLTPASANHLAQVMPVRLKEFEQGILKTYTDKIEQPCKDGSTVWTETTTRFVAKPDNGHLEVYGISRDITERKRSEEITRQQSEQIQLLYEASQQLNRTLDLKEIYQTICNFMSVIAPNDTLFISAFDRETQLITCRAYWLENKWLDVTPFPAIPLEEEGKGTQSLVIRTGESMLINDYQALIRNTKNVYLVEGETNEIIIEDPSEEEEEEEEVTHSALIVPLKSGGMVTGVIQVASYRKNAYTENQLKLLESLALHIASAEQNAMLYTKMLNELNERRHAEVALRASKEKYRVLIESMDSAIVTVDRDGKFLYMNDVAAVLMGDSTDKLIGKTMYDLFPETIASSQMNAIQRVVSEDKGNIVEATSLVRGEYRWYRASIQPIHDEDGCVGQILINLTDIHNLKTTQQKLQELNHTLEERVKQRTAEVQDLYDNAPAGYHSLDANGNILMINQTELNWLGYTREEVIGHSIQNFFTSDSIAIFKENFPAFKKCGWLRDLELEFVRKDGSIMPILINATAINDEYGNYVTSRSTVFDNTDHKAADEALRNANLELARAMRMKDEFLASMSHELRTPLNGILGLSEALQLDVYGPLNEKQKSTLVHIENSGRHLLELINDILDVSKIEAGKFELEMNICSLGDICQSSIHLTKGMAAKKHQNVNFTMAPASISINGDARRLKQVLVNLLSNAVKFTPESGDLGLEVTASETDNIVYISVWDKGIGISPEDIKKLFQPFVQLDSSLSRQQTGTGLGLTLVHRLVEMHGGSIEIQSVPRQGSRFTVALPCLPSDSLSEADENLFQSKFHHALIVENESMNAGHLARYCKALGISTTILSSGKEALKRVTAIHPNIIFLNIHLPDISGWDVLGQLKTNPDTQHIPIVITSVDDEKEKASQLHADGYLVKFFSLSDLRSIMTNIQKGPSTDEFHSTAPGGPIATVMIVDDNEINIDTVADYLGAKNFNVVSAKSGVEFISHAPQFHPDIVLMDIQMPDMDGLETIRRLRALTDPKLSSIPVVALTALAMPGDRERCIEAGADEYVTKPFRLKELQELIMQILKDKKRLMWGIGKK